MSNLTKRWPQDRIEELLVLQDLLQEVRSINNGSGALERIARCIALAEKISHTDLVNCRPDLLSFLFAKANSHEKSTD
jgi:hypothetical protein